MELIQKLQVLSDAAKYDSACTSSGSERAGKKGHVGSAVSAGICHSFTSDGRCVSLLKVLQTNHCIFDCKYCFSRSSNDIQRAAFTPRELAGLTTEFYRRNYIEGLFLSSAVTKSPDYTMELMIKTIWLLRNEYKFNGYIHAKCIPHADPRLIDILGHLVDRISVNIELPSELSLKKLAPDKTRQSILKPMGHIAARLQEKEQTALAVRHDTPFSPGGHATQMIIGATPDSDLQIIRLSESLYNRYSLKRVFYSAFMPGGGQPGLVPAGPAPLLREHRLYQADWLLRFYGFQAEEILDEGQPNFNVFFDPKCDWALRHMGQFPVEVMRADKETLLRVPGLGLRSVERILAARRHAPLTFDALKRMGVVLKRAHYFLTCQGKPMLAFPMNPEFIAREMLMGRPDVRMDQSEQISFIQSAGLPILSQQTRQWSATQAWQAPALLAAPPSRESLYQSLTGEI